MTITDETVEIPNLSVYDAVFGDIAEADLDSLAIIDSATGIETTYRDLIVAVDAFAGALAARGLGTGDVIGLQAPNSTAFAVAFHGILRAGATATTVNSLSTQKEIQRQLEMAGARAHLTVSVLGEASIAAARGAGIADDRIVVLDGSEGFSSLADLLDEKATPPEVSFDPATHVAVIPFSSGTTGVPKGVMLSHRNLVANVYQCVPRVGLEPEERILAVLPFFHIYGMTVLLNLALRCRSTLVTMPRFDLAGALELIQNRRVSFVFIAPPMAVALGKHPLVDDYDLSSLRTLFSGAAPLDERLAQLVVERLGVEILQGYGMTELSPVSHAVARGTGQQRSLSQVGQVIAQTEDRLVDTETLQPIDAPETGLSEPGEVWARGPQVMLGYFNNPEATAATITEDGWLRTGDIGVFDSDRNLYIVDRLKELIKYKGYQVAPAELEAVLLGSDAVADAAVVGEPVEGGDELPVAFVVPIGDPTPQQIMDEVNSQVAPYKKLRRVEFIDAVPKSASGKILRKDLKAELVARSDD